MTLTGYMVSSKQYFALVRRSKVPLRVREALSTALGECSAIRPDDGMIDSFKAGLAMGLVWRRHPEWGHHLQKIRKLVRNRDNLSFLEIDGRPVKDT